MEAGSKVGVGLAFSPCDHILTICLTIPSSPSSSPLAC